MYVEDCLLQEVQGDFPNAKLITTNTSSLFSGKVLFIKEVYYPDSSKRARYFATVSPGHSLIADVYFDQRHLYSLGKSYNPGHNTITELERVIETLVKRTDEIDWETTGKELEMLGFFHFSRPLE